MSGKPLFLLIAVIAGVLMAVQGSMNSRLGRIVGLWEATFLVHLVGLSTLLVILYVLRLGKGNLSKTWGTPWYLLLGGLLGVLIIYGVVTSIPRLGVAVATTSIIVGQVLTALIIDHFGLFGLMKVPFTWLKGVGLVLLAIGAKLLLN